MYRFNNKKVDTNLFLQLQDLTTVLSGNRDLEFEFNFGSFIDVIDHKVTASRFWDNTKPVIHEAGLKSDVFLRTVGTLHHTNLNDIKQYLEEVVREVSIPKFATQLFALFEDIRLQEIIRKERPGTKKVFDIRNSYHKQHFETQLNTNITRSYSLDELFCLIYLLIESDVPDPVFPRANEKQLSDLEKIKPFLYELFEAKTTRDVVHIAEKIVLQIDGHYRDSYNEYFVLPVSHIDHYTRNTLFDELTRTDKLTNDDYEEVDQEKSEYIDEKFSTWHRESKNGEGNQTFLQFELDQGTKTSLIGDGARETEEGDQAMASIQGASGQSKQNDYSDMESLEEKETEKGNQQDEAIYGEENRDAVKIDKVAEKPEHEDIQLYKEYVMEIEAYQRKLARTIEKTLEHKKNAPRKDLLFGRLSKKLLPIVIDNDRRIFYKKNHESKEMDAVFTLLVDCSASMHNKMEETKKGIVLFHEVLKQLKIKHSIIGFWEDANDVKEGYQPNYFHRIHTFNDSLYENNGPKIMQLEPEEDNRDGYSIRVITKELEARREKNKFLLVFSDGEPAASNYEQNGIVDTHEAVLEARKKGIDVIGMFLANGEVQEHEDLTMKNIYGRERLMIPGVSELPDHFTPLLKKLLLKAI
ncbi:vWA domain-containing protein [Ornithinibacillus halophilus]|uniref:Nitric oxide reductase activation protein n=1 Tax=Ornithinibacillus halophilus TaxID=930117 RepID=A0A1M5EV77_9BACI|nr:VWA domain-containing protein [Ornithinibacillus halophilus]SHF83069.1 Nitric oxide reductase activation protein [Ornithinibacillus halophilus]